MTLLILYFMKAMVFTVRRALGDDYSDRALGTTRLRWRHANGFRDVPFEDDVQAAPQQGLPGIELQHLPHQNGVAV
jgi:hypothetical protein